MSHVDRVKVWESIKKDESSGHAYKVDPRFLLPGTAVWLMRFCVWQLK